MSKADGMIGKTYGEWLVLEKRDNRKVLCRCSCGVEREVAEYSLTSGSSTNCGHLRLAENLVGKTYGELEVIGKGSRSTYWICRCSCGKIIEANKYRLEHGKKTCGHRTKEDSTMIGKKFGKLTVKEFNINTKLWICQCECGNLKEVSTRDLNSGNIKSCGNHKEIHLDGQIFGDLTVIGKAENSSLLVCRCSCGGTILTSGIKLINGEITHCKSTAHKEPKYNLEGLKFGKLTVIRFNSTTRLWECKCECGNTKEVKGSNLINKRVMSCGCLLNSPKLDLTGRIFGKLEVIKYIGKSNYECRCSCGNTRVVRAHALMSGQTTQCKKCKEINLTGQVINELTVLHKDPNNGSKWVCKCSCGNIVSVQTGKLTHRLQLSCGHVRDAKFVDISGKRFGKLVVGRYLGNQSWLCKCDCGRETVALGHNLRNGNIRSCGCNTLNLYKESMLRRYGDTSSKHIDSPRSRWQISILEDKEAFNAFIIKVSIELNRFPFIDDLAEMLGVTRTTIKNYINKYEIEIYSSKDTMEDSIHNMYKFMERHDRKILNGREIDLLDREHSVGIEFNGSYWHSDIFLDKKYHQDKTIEAKKNNIRLIHIFEYEWKDSVKREKIIKLIDRAVKPHLNTKVFGRNTEIKIIAASDASEFLNKYHLDGYLASKYHLGCFKNTELIGVMSLGRSRFDKNYDFEIIRLAWKDNIIVIGGISKFLRFANTQLGIRRLISYVDASKFDCNGYIKSGFKLANEYLTDPSYMWIKGDTVLSRYQTQKHKLIINYPEYSDLTEDEIMIKLGYYKLYNCGNYKLYYDAEEINNGTV